MTETHPMTKCAYYRGVGHCSFGCWEEPRCYTEEPMNGWNDDGKTGVFSIGGGLDTDRLFPGQEDGCDLVRFQGRVTDDA